MFPLSTEPGAFYPNLRGAYCFEEGRPHMQLVKLLRRNRCLGNRPFRSNGCLVVKRKGEQNMNITADIIQLARFTERQNKILFVLVGLKQFFFKDIPAWIVNWTCKSTKSTGNVPSLKLT